MPARKPESTASDLRAPERVMLFCLASGTPWEQVGVPHVTPPALASKESDRSGPCGRSFQTDAAGARRARRVTQAADRRVMAPHLERFTRPMMPDALSNRASRQTGFARTLLPSRGHCSPRTATGDQPDRRATRRRPSHLARCQASRGHRHATQRSAKNSLLPCLTWLAATAKRWHPVLMSTAPVQMPVDL